MTVIFDYNLICKTQCYGLNQPWGSYDSEAKDCVCGFHSKLWIKTQGQIKINPVPDDDDLGDEEPAWQRSKWAEPKQYSDEPKLDF